MDQWPGRPDSTRSRCCRRRRQQRPRPFPARGCPRFGVFARNSPPQSTAGRLRKVVDAYSLYSGKPPSYQESELNTLLARMYGVLRSPRPTFAAILRAPSWAPVLVATTAITFLCSLGFLRTDVGRQALVDQWERTATAFGQTVDDAAYARMEERAEGGGLGVMYAAATALGYGPVLVFGVSALLFFVLTPRHSYAQVLAVVAHAGVILALRQVIATPLDYARESIASPTTLVQFFSMFDEASPVARFLGVIDQIGRASCRERV